VCSNSKGSGHGIERINFKESVFLFSKNDSRIFCLNIKQLQDTEKETLPVLPPEMSVQQ